MVAGGTMGMGCHKPSSDSADPDLVIDRAMLMKAKPLKFDKTAPSSKYLVVIHKLQSRKKPHALTIAVAASAAAASAAATEEDTTGSHSQP